MTEPTREDLSDFADRITAWREDDAKGYDEALELLVEVEARLRDLLEATPRDEGGYVDTWNPAPVLDDYDPQRHSFPTIDGYEDHLREFEALIAEFGGSGGLDGPLDGLRSLLAEKTETVERLEAQLATAGIAFGSAVRPDYRKLVDRVRRILDEDNFDTAEDEG